MGIPHNRSKHKFQDFIDAENEGKQIQYCDPYGVYTPRGKWIDKKVGKNFYPYCEYRIKPNIKVQFDDPSNDIEDILDCFDFERVKKVMDFLDWQWYDVGVPEIWDLRKKARNLLNNVWDNVVKKANETPDEEVKYFIATGGFYAEAIKYPECKKIFFILRFQIADWDNWC
nr:MAG: hypothetical protein [Caudoviricetes sp.]